MGGEHLEAAVNVLQNYGRVVACGMGPVDQRRSHLMGATHLLYRSKSYFLGRVYLVQDVNGPV